MENQEKEKQENAAQEKDNDDNDQPNSTDPKAESGISCEYSTLTDISDCESEYSTIVYQVGNTAPLLL